VHVVRTDILEVLVSCICVHCYDPCLNPVQCDLPDSAPRFYFSSSFCCRAIIQQRWLHFASNTLGDLCPNHLIVVIDRKC